MARFEDYAKKYTHVQMERRDGILLMRLHTDGGLGALGYGPGSTKKEGR
ncbi:MAG: hypothetical protein AB1671_11585 [Thermodesulfobacteriota bacterium]|jgi:hypothetical protein